MKAESFDTLFRDSTSYNFLISLPCLNSNYRQHTFIKTMDKYFMGNKLIFKNTGSFFFLFYSTHSLFLCICVCISVSVF